MLLARTAEILLKLLQKLFTIRPGMMVHAYNSSYAGGGGKRITVRGQSWAKSMRPYLKTNQSKKSWVMAQVVEHLPSKHKVLMSNSIPPIK
jgi:hypothetical protein